MTLLRILIKNKFKMFWAILSDKSINAQIRNVSMVIVLGSMLYVSYLFFYNLIFRYVINLEQIGFLLIERLVSVGFLAFFFMLVISSFVTALATLFRSTETEYLFSTPIPDLLLFTSKYIDIVIYSSWAILIMSLPILYSYAKVHNFGTSEYVLTGILVLLPFTLIASAMGTLIALLAGYISKRIRLKIFFIIGGLVFIALVYSIIHFSRPTQLVIPFTDDFRSLNLFINNFHASSHPFTPNYWLIQCLHALVHHDYASFSLYVSAMISSGVFSLALLYTVADRIFFKTWLTSTEEAMAEKRKTTGTIQAGTGFLSKPTKNQVRTLLNKDVLIFIREPRQWAQFFLLLALVAVYFVNLHYIPEEIEIEQWRTIISIMNFAFCGFVLATLAVRFAYPSISMEGDSIWVLGSAPLSARTLFREKFWSSFIVFLIITEFIAFISGSMLKLEELYQLLTISGIFLMSMAISSLAVGFGAAFPDFSERNPSRIASSPGGVLTIVVSMFYIGLMMALFAIPCYTYTRYLIEGGEFPLNIIVISAISALVLNAATIIIPLRMGAQSLAKREY
ncbi:MAG: hypothetical protein HOC71_05575 [Candidatus Latescibacteria bacterium]|jgi:ABC-2 type transport system permease protein|nr:hypothetical protein [Candidatus Latescibacterota bacterium]